MTKENIQEELFIAVVELRTAYKVVKHRKYFS